MADQSGAPPKPRIIEVGISVYLPKNTLFSIAVAISIIIICPISSSKNRHQRNRFILFVIHGIKRRPAL